MKKKVLPIIALVFVLLSVLIGASACGEEQVPVERIALTSLPRLEYYKGEPFDLSDAQIAVYYANGRRESMPLTFEMVSDYDPQQIGDHVLTINFEGVFTNIKIRITNAPITTIQPVYDKIPYRTEYIEGQDLDIANLYLKINYQSGDPDIIPVTQDMVSGYNRDIIGQQQITITYLNEYTTHYTVTVREKQINSISISHPPQKTLYWVNEKIEIQKGDLDEGELFISYDNGYTEYKDFNDLYETQAEFDEALEYDTSRPANREIVRLHYGGKNVIFDIKVLIPAAELILVKSLPYGPKGLPQGFQLVGCDLSLEGGLLEITYNNETTEKDVEMSDERISYSGYDKNVMGEQEITLSFNHISETVSFTITVIDATPEVLEILPPVLNEENQAVRYSEVAQTPKTPAPFYQEGVIDLSLWEYRLKMNNDTYSSIYPVTEGMLEGDSSQLELEEFGEKTLTFTYKRDEIELQDQVTFEVIQKLLDKISLIPPENNIFYRNEPLVLSGAMFTAYYNDGTEYTKEVTIDMISGYNSYLLGEQDVIVTYQTQKYGSKFATFRVLVIRKAIYIEFVTAQKTEYVLGEDFILDGLVMKIHYEGFGQPENISGPFGEEWSFHNTHFDEVGLHQVIVRYQAYGLVLEAAIPVTVRNNLMGIELVRLIDQEYVPETVFPDVVAGLDIDLEGYYLKRTFENGVDYIAVTKNMLDYQRIEREPGERAVNINYQGLTILASVTVIEVQISSLSLVQAPFKEYYKANQPAILDIEGLEMIIDYTNETSLILNENILFEQNLDTLEYRYLNLQGEEKSIVLTITELDTSLEPDIDYETRTITIKIDEFEISFDVIIAYRIATAITWDISADGEEPTEQPTIMAYQGRTQIDFPAGAAFKVIFNEGEFYEIIDINDNLDSIEILDYNHNEASVQIIHLRYQDILLSCTVHVREKELLKIEFADDFHIPDVTEGMSLDLRKARIKVYYYHNLDMEEGIGEGDIDLGFTIVPLSPSMLNYSKEDLSLGTRPIIITFSHSGVSKTLLYNINVIQKQLVEIRMGNIPKTKYIELDPFTVQGGTVILYYNNNTTQTLSLTDAKSEDIKPQDTFILNKAQFNNEDFSGFARRQQIFITYIEGNIVAKTSYDIIMHDRMYIEIVFEENDFFNENDNTYYFRYGQDREINYEIWGYSAHTDQPENVDMVKLELEEGINYIFKYINIESGEEFGSWPKDAGTYEIYLHYDANSAVNNDRIHNSFLVNYRRVVIRPKEIHIIPNDVTKVYGEHNPQFICQFYAVEYIEQPDGSYEMIYSTENVFGYDETASILGEISYSFLNSMGVQMEIGKKTSVGTYIIRASVADHRNYTITLEDAEFEITKREIMVIANSHQKEYGQADPAFTYTTAAVLGNPRSGLIEGDSFDGYLLRVSPSLNNSVGEYEILFAPPGNLNYEVQYISNYLTIYKRNLYLTVGNYTKIYGQSMPDFTVTASSDYAQAFAYNDSIASLLGELEFVCEDNNGDPVWEGTDVGEYVIKAQGLTSRNYNIIYFDGMLTIQKREIEIQALDCQKIYGDEDPLFEYTIRSIEGIPHSGLFGQDQLFGVLERETGQDVGEYRILLGSVHHPNYIISNFIEAVLTVTPKYAEIEIQNLTKQYDGNYPHISDEDYEVIDNDGNIIDDGIKERIQFSFGVNASPNIGSYRVGFSSTDSNHILQLKEEYWYEITRRQVRAEFYNIPYGQLVDGEYTGSVYKGSPFQYEARIREGDLVEGDTVYVNLQTAAGENPQEYSFENRDNVINVGFYTVRIHSLSNNNYQLEEPSIEEIELHGNYRYTSFKIIPVEIKVLITIENMSKTYTGSEISFNNILTEVDGYYQTKDYRLLTELEFYPQGLNVYPYYLNPQNQERFPRAVKYKMIDGEYVIEDGDYVIEGYNIKAVTGNSNYTAVIVDENGEPLERDEDYEIIDEDYRFKIIPQIIYVNLAAHNVTKVYDGNAPSLGKGDYTLSSNPINNEVNFTFVRKDEYPEFMEGYIEDKDRGVFKIIPSTPNMNYRLELAPDSQFDYEIKEKVLGSWRISDINLRKQFDGLKPALNSEQLSFDNYAGNYVFEERRNLNFRLDFGEVTDFNVGSYSFVLRFMFPTENDDHSQDEIYKHYLDYNHRLSDITTLNRVFTIEPRQVLITLLEGEGYNWKHYNGLQGSMLKDGINLMGRAFRIIDARYSEEGMSTQVGTFENGDPILRMHLLNNESLDVMSDLITGELTLNNSSIINAGQMSSISISQIQALNGNFNIIMDNRIGALPFEFRIEKQIVYYYIEDISRFYGEELTLSQYVFNMTEENWQKVVGIDQEDVPSLFVQGGLFDRQYLFPRAIDEHGVQANRLTETGEYLLQGDDYLNLINYRLYFDTNHQTYLEITRRELPVEYVNSYPGFFTVTRVYGEENPQNIIFNYAVDDGGEKGLLLEDINIVSQPDFDSPRVALIEGVGDDIYTEVGIIQEDALIIDFEYTGLNKNYFFSYDAFNGINPKLEIIKADLYIQLLNNDQEPYLEAEYGTPPSQGDYFFKLDGLRLDDTIWNIALEDIDTHLPEDTLIINGEEIFFPSVAYTQSMDGYCLGDLLTANLDLTVNFNEDTMTVDSHYIIPIIGFLNYTINRTAYNGQVYPYVVDILQTKMKNYNLIPLETEYKVLQRQIDIYLELLYKQEEGQDTSGENAIFNILYGEVPYQITDEMVLLSEYTKEELLLKKFQKFIIALNSIGVKEALLVIRGKRDILLVTEIINQYQYENLSDQEIDDLFEELSEERLMLYLGDFGATDEEVDQIFDSLTAQDIEKAYDELMTDQIIYEIYNEEGFTQEELEIIYADIINTLDPDQQRLIYRFRYDLSRLVNDDTLGFGSQYTIDVSNLILAYDPSVGENKGISAWGAVGYKYAYNYVQSQLNIYNYVTSVGYNNELPNVMLTGSDEFIEFIVRVNFADGTFKYLHFVDRDKDTDIPQNIDYMRWFEYVSDEINPFYYDTNQTIVIKYNEILFGYKHFEIVSQPFQIRMFDDEDYLYWSRGKSLPNDYTGGTFVSSLDTRDIGEKIDQNYTYYVSERDAEGQIIKAMYNFDYINTLFRLSPKAGMTNYYFDIILNSDETSNRSLTLRFSSGAMETLTLITKYNENITYHTQLKPGELDLFDGRTHEVTAYIDKLGVRAGDPSGYKVIVVIDKAYYFSFALGKGESYQPCDLSLAGFLAHDTYAWISRFDIYKQGLVSSRVDKIMPSSSSYYSHHYTINDGTGNIIVALKNLVEFYIFPNSSYLPVTYPENARFEISLNGVLVDTPNFTVLLHKGVHIMKADMYYQEEYMDSMTIVITVSENYNYHYIDYQGYNYTPYMSKPVDIYGYDYQTDEEIINQSIERNTYTQNADFRYIKTVVDLNFAHYQDGEYPDTTIPLDYQPQNPLRWYYPYSAAIILKTTHPLVDIRDASNTSTDFNGIGIYIRYDGYGNCYTRVFLRVNGLIYLTDEYMDINWQSAQRTVVEASFVEETGSIYIQIHNGNGTYNLRFGNGTQLGSEYLNSASLLPIITNAASCSAIWALNTKVTIYQMETGFRTIGYNNFYNYDTGEFISNVSGGTEFIEGDRIFLDNGSGLPMVSDYSKYSITFKATDTGALSEQEYFRLLIGTNKPEFITTNDNKGIYLGYKKNNVGIDYLYFGFYKEQYEYREQLVYEQIGENTPDLLDGQEHTIEVTITREIETFSRAGYVMTPTDAYSARIKIDGQEILQKFYMPVSNDLGNWALKNGSMGFGDDTNYDTRFLNNNLYPGFEIRKSVFTVIDLTVS
mgnify:CR=1 FL=1